MSLHIQGQGRHQATLLPEVLDDFVAEDNPVRVIDVFVDELNLESLGFQRVQAKQTGRPGYHPATMLKLYIYGYLNRIQSSRRLEKESHRNVELMWLLERLTPDFKTIADFRKDNGKGIKNACRQFVELCRQLNMFAGALFVIDGSKFKAVNNKSKNYTQARLKHHIERTEKNIQKYLSQLDEQDSQDMSDDDRVTVEKLEGLKQRLQELKSIEEKVKAHPDKQISFTDLDARMMQSPSAGITVSYNVQSAVDTKHHLIVAHDVINKPDKGHLSSVTQQVQQALNKRDITVLADKGYFSRLDIKETLDNGAQAYVPISETSSAGKKGIFHKSLFKYDKEKDIYICPAGNELSYNRNSDEKGIKLKIYSNFHACKDCAIRSKCTTSDYEPRKMRRWIHEEIIDDMQSRLKASPDITVLRKQTVEHPFGTIKMWMGATHFLTKRFHNVSTEVNLHVLAYNLKRMMSILGVTELISAIRG